jgi:hypothetical protein
MNYTTSYQRRRFAQAFQLLLIGMVLVIERVVGLPIFFLGITIQSVELTDRQTRRFILIVASIALAMVYQTSFLTCFLIVGLGEIVWSGLSNISSSKTARVLASVLVMLLSFVVLEQISWSWRMGIYSALSTAVLINIVRSTQQFTMRQ